MTPGGSCDGAGSAPVASTSGAAAANASTSGSKGAGGGGGVTASASMGAGGMKKGPWTASEDSILVEYVRKHGEGNWNAVQKNSGLSRCGKSCRLRWANHLRPNLKKGPFSPDEERLILELHAKLGNKWARMAAQLPGRTDNEIKNYWNTRIKRRQRAGLPLYPSDLQHHHSPAAFHHRPSASGLTPASLPDPKALYSTSIGATPLSVFDTITFASQQPPPSTTPLLGPAHHSPFLAPSRPKHLRDDDPASFSRPFSTTNTPPPSQNPFFPFTSMAGFNLLGPPPPAHHHQQQQHLQHDFSVKMELPSSQFFPEPPRAIATGAGMPLGSSNSELLDALLRDTHVTGSASDGKGGGVGDDGGAHQRGLLPEPSNMDADGPGGELEQGLVLGTAGGEWADSDHPINTVTKREAADDAGSVDDDLSAFLDLIPMATAAPAAAAPGREWYNSDSGEVSNGQSSGVTDENVGMEMQHLAWSLSMAAGEEDHSWSIGSCHWNDMPSTC